MKTKSTRVFLLAAVILAVSPIAGAQSALDDLEALTRMQQAIHDQETAGNLDEAVAIFRELAVPQTANRALAAEAQYRLGQSLLQKGDLNAAAREFWLLAGAFPEYSDLVSKLAGAPEQLVATGQIPNIRQLFDDAQAGRAGAREVLRLFLEDSRGQSPLVTRSRSFEPGAVTTITGTVTDQVWANPVTWLLVDDGETLWSLQLPIPMMLLRRGLTRDSLPEGEIVTVVVTRDQHGTVFEDGSVLGRAESIVRVSDQTQLFDRAAGPENGQ